MQEKVVEQRTRENKNGLKSNSQKAELSELPTQAAVSTSRSAQRWDAFTLGSCVFWDFSRISGRRRVYNWSLEPLSPRSGQSNPTFFLQKGSQAYVLRKKPPGSLLPKAHKVRHRNAASLSSTTSNSLWKHRNNYICIWRPHSYWLMQVRFTFN